MPYTLNRDHLKVKKGLTRTEERKLDEFMDMIDNTGVSPQEAAGELRLTLKKLKGTANQYEIYLSGGNRATFTIDGNVVTMLQAGGHT